MRIRLLGGLLLTGVMCAQSPRRKVIIDQDGFGPGGSNQQAILFILKAPDVDVLGITIESGDGWQAENVAHTLRMLELVGRTDVPVIAGAIYPLVNSEEETERWEALYGKLAYKGAWMKEWPGYATEKREPYHPAEVVPPIAEGMPKTKVLPITAVEFLLQQTAKYPGEVSVVALGPMTNLALAAKIDPDFAARAKDLTFMGGSLNPQPASVDEFSLQFIHNPRVEFNFRWDPEAAKITLHAGWKKIVQVPLDATTDTKVTADLLAEASKPKTAIAAYLGAYGQVNYPMWDEVAAAAWIDPTIARHEDEISIDVDIGHGADYGSEQSWPSGSGPGLGEPVVTVVRKVDVSRLEKEFVGLGQP